MFLGLLNEKSKELFLQLSLHAALSNEDFAKEQEVLINEYCREMGIESYEMDIKIPLEDIINEIRENASEQEKNIITLEIVALILADKKVDIKEREFLVKYIDKIGLTEDKLDEIIDMISKFNEVFNEMSSFVGLN